LTRQSRYYLFSPTALLFIICNFHKLLSCRAKPL
jgi:hypothetical protein